MSDEDEFSERIAGELHDGVAQWLIGAKMQAEGLRLRLAKGAEIDIESVDSLIRTLTSGIQETRRLMRGLSGPQIEDGYWCKPLQYELEMLQQQTQANKPNPAVVQFEFAENVQPLAEPVSATAFRIIREAVWNALRHARATTIRVQASRLGNSLSLTVVDDGRGFDPTQLPADRMGVSGLKRRATAVGGTLEVDSSPSTGTRIVCKLPLG